MFLTQVQAFTNVTQRRSNKGTKSAQELYQQRYRTLLHRYSSDSKERKFPANV